MNPFDEDFRMYVSDEPAEPWGYDVDDYGISYGLGWWPWYRHHGWTRAAPAGLRPGSLRLLPDPTYEAGNQLYVLAWLHDDGCGLELSWMTRRQGLGGMVRKGWVKLDRELAIVSAVPAEVRGEVESRVAKFCTLYRKAIAERDSGRKAPVTAHEKWLRQQASE
ncbi:MAG: hypothetical protein ABSG53_18865 [Thermoguttaceae bacterium]